MIVVTFFVPGEPQPGGSKRGYVNKKTGHVVIVEDARKNGPWRDRVAFYAQEAYSGPLLVGALAVRMTFTKLRPASHYGTGGNSHLLKPSARRYPTIKPDVLKLARSTEDALTGVIWRDDVTTVRLTLEKTYGPRPGAHIQIRALEDE